MAQRASHPGAAPSPYRPRPDAVARNRRLAVALVAAAAAAPAVVVLVVLVLLWSLVAGIVVGVVAWAALTGVLWRRGTGAVLSVVGGEAADPVAHARLVNLVASLCVAGGITPPALRVLAAAEPDALAVGTSPRDATLVVTSGLLDTLSRVELEGVLAHELSHIRQGDVVVSAALGATLDPLARVAPSLAVPIARAVTGRREALADMAAIGLTRYPPGLIAALEKMRAARVGRRSPTVDLLWTVPPAPADDPMGGALVDPVDARIQALMEL